jgi:CoA:oxalate CoA-transferase
LGYGQTGPSSSLPAYPPAIHVASGFDMAHIAYQPGRERPDNCGIYIADIVSGTHVFGAILAALAQRQTTGHGQHVDVSMLETMLTLMVAEIQAAQFPVAPPGRPMFGQVRTKDGYIMPAVASEKTFQSLCREQATQSGSPIPDSPSAPTGETTGGRSSTNWNYGLRR